MNRQIIDEAAEWFVEFSTGDVDRAAKNAFDKWLRKSPEHVRAYLELLPIWDDGAIALPEDATSAEELIALARAQDNVVPMERRMGLAPPLGASTSARTETQRRPRAIFRSRVFVLAASIAAVIMVSAWALWFAAYHHPTYTTDLGQQRTITLADGSVVQLNTQSRIRVRFSREARQVELLQGQALFRVAKDALRPFTVNSDSTEVRAVGTQFDVYRREGRTTVTVVEGKVTVHSMLAPASPRASDASTDVGASPGTSARNAVLVSAGEQLTLTPTEAPKPTPADVSLATAWTEGRMIFEATPLPDVAAEFNRYNEQRIIIEDSSLRDFLVNGSFRSSDPTSLTRFLQEQPTLSVHETADEIRISRR